jgi:DNA ligase-associated metallophosphoesterase
MTPAPLHIAGERIMLDPAGALYWPAERLLIVSDLHLETGSAHALRGSLLPPWDSKATLDRLAGLVRRLRPATIVALGDSFHDRDAAQRLAADQAARLAAIAHAVDFIWVLGNHDPAPPRGFAGRATHEHAVGPFVLRHEASVATRGTVEICGHCHPKAAVPTRAAQVTRPCFVVDSRRIMLPAFGVYTGGLDVRHPAIAGLFPHGGRVFVLGQERLFSFALCEAMLAR